MSTPNSPVLSPSLAALAHGPAVLSVNAGSSSLKFGLYGLDGGAVWTGQFEGLEPGGAPTFKVEGERGTVAVAAGQSPFEAALADLLGRLQVLHISLTAVTHRVVHGGDRFTQPVLIDDEVLAYLHTLEVLAPLHQPANLIGVEAFRRALPTVPQVACFDTAFHATMSENEKRLPLPAELAAQGLRRYGYHGLSYQYVSAQLARHSQRAGGRALLAHLGNGASLAATREGRCVATTMGFSTLEGLMMGTRCGSIDAGVLMHLLRAGWDLARLEKLLYKDSGLKGVSGLSADMRSLRGSAEPAAAGAIALFAHRLLRESGALIALLGGLDVLAFTGGIGENDAATRADLCAALAYLGVSIDAAANAQPNASNEPSAIHTPDSRVEVWIVPTDEGRVAANSALELVGARR